jgi:hypothetical protein
MHEFSHSEKDLLEIAMEFPLTCAISPNSNGRAVWSDAVQLVTTDNDIITFTLEMPRINQLSMNRRTLAENPLNRGNCK